MTFLSSLFFKIFHLNLIVVECVRMFSSFSKWLGQFFSMEGESYTAQHEHYQQAAGFIRQALEYDEQSSKINFIPHSNLVYSLIEDPEMAMSLYRQGIQELEKSLNLPVDPNGNKKRNMSK